jgi:hypothetical protein
MRTALAVVSAILLANCSDKDLPPTTAGTGVLVDADSKLSVDPSQVPVVPGCPGGYVVRRAVSGPGWECLPNSVPWSNVTDVGASTQWPGSVDWTRVSGVASSTQWAGAVDWNHVSNAPSFVTGVAPIFFGCSFIPANGTTFSPPNGVAVNFGTEAFMKVPVPRGGTLANFFVRPTGTTAAGSQVTVTLRVNGADTPLLLTFTSADGARFKSDTRNTVALAAGDAVSMKYSESAGVEPGVGYTGSVEFK